MTNPGHAASEIFNQEPHHPEKEFSHDLSARLCGELLDPSGWHKVLDTFARTMKLAVAITGLDGRMIGACHNPQPAWSLTRAAIPAADGSCPFCLAPPGVCHAVEDALKTGAVVMVEDNAGLAHVAVPLSLGGRQLGTLIAGQSFSRYPERLPLLRVARDFGISPQQFWHEALQQVPISRANLQLYADLLLSLGQAVLGERYAAILQKKFAQTSQRYRLFIDGVKEYSLHTTDRLGRITSWSRGAEILYGYTESEMLGRDAARLRGPEESHRDALRKEMVEVDRSGSIQCEGWRFRKDGTRFFGAGVLTSLGTGDGFEYGELLRDVTELRRREQDLLQSQKLEAIGVLAGGIAHDFNNLLTSITMTLSFLETSLPPDDPAYPMIGIAEKASARAADLVAQLLGYAGKGSFVISRFDFSDLISEMLPLIAAGIPKTVVLEPLLTSGLPLIEGDAGQVRQVVMNLILNGAESIGENCGTVRILTGVSDSGGNVFMEVMDSGSGMSETTQARMFDPFFTTKFTGRGLGLAAVSGIVREHKGKIHVDSAPGLGTTFTVSFPAAPAGVLRRIAPATPDISPGADTILIVDDEPELREMTKLILTRAGYSVLAAENGREAVELFRQNASRIRLILLDMTMPVMGGHEALQLIREVDPAVPVIMTSAYSQESALEGFLGDPVAQFIQKPYGPAKLVRTIQEVLQDSAQE